MLTISLKEFKNLFQSIRSIIIICILFGVTLGAAKLVSNFQGQLDQLGFGNNAYATGATIIVLLAGPLFVLSLSHNVINQELSSRTIRFIATKTTRFNFVTGKMLGVTLFWITCLLIAFLLIIPFSKAFFFLEFAQTFIFILYYVGLSILLSTLIPKPSLTMFIGVSSAVAFTVLGFWSMASDNIFLKIFSFITPYFYYSHAEAYMAFPVLLFPIIFLAISLFVFKRRDL
ncbi:ABC transporter permease subunit [Halobacillus sp. Cin3]|uniref:ABC transporter permease subunit n=1 Tax=Halobacillus sp. Cin3 TaxID=2928441 RepID=UPI00248D586F|nr:ABC transporter permease subunit [Halobacillus sp. Cin3]